jgi:hypothetical protein
MRLAARHGRRGAWNMGTGLATIWILYGWCWRSQKNKKATKKGYKKRLQKKATLSSLFY